MIFRSLFLSVRFFVFFVLFGILDYLFGPFRVYFYLIVPIYGFISINVLGRHALSFSPERVYFFIFYVVCLYFNEIE